MDAEIIAVGSELLTPQRSDTNSLWLTDQLNALGVEVVMKSIVGDDRARLAGTVKAALERIPILILTGGLGPTEDDVTREAVAAALGRELIFVPSIVEAIQQRFAGFKRRMVEINKRQAYLIEGAEALENPNGTAPGQWLRVGERVVMLLPGPPREMKPMFTDHCAPRLEPLLPKQVLRTLFWRVAGMPESDLDQLISPVYTKYTNPVTTILAAPGDIQIHLRARCGTAEEAQRLIDEVAAQIEPLLGDRLYSRDGSPLEAVVGAALHSRAETLAVAESITGGYIAERITSVAGSSRYFRGGFLTYTDDIKAALLGVDPGLIREHTAVSEPVARAMATGARERTGATWALSATGYAGPDGGDERNPAGTVFLGLAGPDGAEARRVHLFGDRERIRFMASQTALDMLRRRLARV